MNITIATLTNELPETAAATMTGPVTREFATAGRATFTISNDQGARYTFRIATSRNVPAGRVSPLFASVREGASYTYLGIVDRASLTLRTTGKSRKPADAIEVRVLGRALDIISGRVAPKAGTILQHAGLCGRCGRKLTVPASIASGIGPDCAEIMGREQQAPAAGTNDSAQVREAIEAAPEVIAVQQVAPPAVHRCGACGGTGIYRGFRKTGNCFRCNGKGHQSEADRRRNYGYDNFHSAAARIS